MTNEIQIANDQLPGAYSPRQPEAWSQGPIPSAPATQSIFLKMHRLLRGRYPIAIALALLCGLGGAIGGWLSKKPLYQSLGMIEIKSSLPSIDPGHQDLSIPDFGSVMAAAELEVSSNDVITKAMGNATWPADRRGGEAQITAFQNALTVELTPAFPDVLKLTLSDPDESVAKAEMNCLCTEFVQYLRGQDSEGYGPKHDVLQKKKDSINVQIAQKQHDLNQATLRTDVENRGNLPELSDPTAISTFLQDRLHALNEAEVELARATAEETEYDAAFKAQSQGGQAATGQGANGEVASSGTSPKTTASTMTPEMIAMNGDLTMKNFLIQRSQLEIQLQDNSQYLPNSPTQEHRRALLDQLKPQIERYAAQYNANPRPQLPTASGMPIPAQISQADVDQKRTAVKTLTQQLTDMQSQIKSLSNLNNDVNQITAALTRLQAESDDTQRKIDDLDASNNLAANQIRILADGQVTEPSNQKRITMAAVGLLGGGAFPVGILLLIGLLDGRYRYSDQTNAEMAGLMMLGMLPNLPDLLSDPEQAATAAHCVHQIRTMLQINGHATDRRVYAITSASSGDGKTSLTLALGLSFAASGSRTLLIDADLVGGGLTSRLGVRVDHGILEAMANTRRLDELTRSTDVTDLSLLPVGLAMGSYTGAISPIAVRKLIAEARKSYDTILIDTGPILGSIEASPVAAAADGVIICVARGQQRSVVDRALLHLQSIGARFAGMVFNRAQAQDFERSLSHMSMQSLPQLNGHARAQTNGSSAHIGPVAKAVASSVRSTVGSSDVN